MADSDALRGRRSYRHRNGDHSLCRLDRCPDAPGDRPAAPVPELVSATAVAFADAEPMVRALAVRLAELALSGTAAAAVSAARALGELMSAQQEGSQR